MMSAAVVIGKLGFNINEAVNGCEFVSDDMWIAKSRISLLSIAV